MSLPFVVVVMVAVVGACVGVAVGGGSDGGAHEASLVKRGVLGHGQGHYSGYQTGHGHGTAHGYAGHTQGHGHGGHGYAGHGQGHGGHGYAGHSKGHGGHGYASVAHGQGHGYAGHGHGHVQHKAPKGEAVIPACAANSTRPWCLEDAEYPAPEIQHAAEHSFHHLLPLYTDVANLNTELSLSRPINTLQDETYLCPSSSSYVRPLRAINTEGKWRVIVNDITLYSDTLTQTARVEVCLTAGAPCPKVPECIGSSCLEKSVYHRFLVYDNYDHHFPFAIESFKLPAACACRLDASTY